jgi:prepilin signal peptidase PulO-like enzyme (type II secretory pathway)
MRGGALIQLIWGSLLATFCIGCAIWTSDALQAGEFGFGVAVTWLFALLFTARGRGEALRAGEPRAIIGPEAVPSSSLGAVLLAIGFGMVMFGFAFGAFFVWFGAGLAVVASGMLVLELREQRRAARTWSEREVPPA